MAKVEVILVGGGTGGHIFPLIAVAEELKRRKRNFVYVGTKNSKEEEITTEAGVGFIAINAGKWRRYLTPSSIILNVVDIFRAIIGFFQAILVLHKTGARVVLSKGGYVALPMVLATKILGRRLVIHESDVVMGLTNKISSKFADKILTAFDPKLFSFADERFEQVGIPVRNSLTQAAQLKSPQKKRPVICIIAGLQGASSINGYLKPILPDLLKKYEVIHSTGEREFDEFAALKQGLEPELAKNYRPYSFFGRELSYYFQLADLIISRSGSTTLVEVSLFSKAMILIPLPNAAGNHQLLNAQLLAKSKAVVVKEERQLNPELLVKEIDELIKSPEVRKELGSNLHRYFNENQTLTKVMEALEIND